MYMVINLIQNNMTKHYRFKCKLEILAWTNFFSKSFYQMYTNYAADFKTDCVARFSVLSCSLLKRNWKFYVVFLYAYALCVLRHAFYVFLLYANVCVMFVHFVCFWLYCVICFIFVLLCVVLFVMFSIIIII